MWLIISLINIEHEFPGINLRSTQHVFQFLTFDFSFICDIHMRINIFELIYMFSVHQSVSIWSQFDRIATKLRSPSVKSKKCHIHRLFGHWFFLIHQMVKLVQMLQKMFNTTIQVRNYYLSASIWSYVMNEYVYI